MRLPVFPNWYPFNDMLLDGHLQIGEYGVKTRSYNWKYRGLVLLYNSLRTMSSCVKAYGYSNGSERHRIIVGVARLGDVRPLNNREQLKMQCNFNNLSLHQVKNKPDLVKVVPYPFGYFFTDIKRFKNPILFDWPAGPVRPIFLDINQDSALYNQLKLVGISR